MNSIDTLRQEPLIANSNAGVQHTAKAPPDPESIRSPEEAAQTFEKILVQQFVKVMTDQMFNTSLSGENGPGWMKSYNEQQRDVLSNVLTEHLVENETFDISSQILKQWQQKGMIDHE